MYMLSRCCKHDYLETCVYTAAATNVLTLCGSELASSKAWISSVPVFGQFLPIKGGTCSQIIASAILSTT